MRRRIFSLVELAMVRRKKRIAALLEGCSAWLRAGGIHLWLLLLLTARNAFLVGVFLENVLVAEHR